MRAPGRNIEPNETCKKLNPHVFINPQMPSPLAHALAATYENPKKRVKQTQKPLMNALETEFYERLKLQYPDAFIMPQGLTFRLGNGVRFTPDFVIAQPMGPSLVAIEVKGKFMWDDASAKLKIAATQYPWVAWKLVWKDMGQWQEQKILP